MAGIGKKFWSGSLLADSVPAMSLPIPPLDLHQVDPRLQEKLGPCAERLGYFGDFFRCAAHQPEALLAFERLAEALRQALPPRLRELVALTVAAITEDHYGRHQREQMAERLGFSREWIAAVLAVDGDSDDALDREERAVQRLVIAAVEGHGRGIGRELTAVVEALGPGIAVAILLLIGRYTTQAIFVNALQLAPPVPSIFGDATS